jgi:hypothetical protein
MATLAARARGTQAAAISLTRAEAIALAALAATFALQLYLAFAKAINWDEYFHYSLIQQHARGEPVQWLQTPFVWLFAWVPGLPGEGIEHIQLIRVLMLPFEAVTCAALFGIARRFAGREAALLCALAYATGGWVFLHAFALRADTIAAALLASALWLATCGPVRPQNMIAIGLLVMLASVATIKSVLWGPAFVGAALLRVPQSERTTWPPLVMVAGTVGVIALAIGGLAALAPDMLKDARQVAIASAERMFSAGLFPQGGYLLAQIGFAPVLAVLAILAAVTLPRLQLPGREKWSLACLLTPMLSVVLYRNAFPYFYAFILPPVAAACAPAAERLVTRYRLVPLCLLLLANAVVLTAMQDRSVPRAQRQVLDGVHAIFEHPVAYIDESGMIPDFPRAVPHFSTGWALEGYWRKGEPEYAEALGRRPVPMMLLNTHTLRNVFEDTGIEEHLMPRDVEVLHASYIPHWGPIYVAGKRIPAGAKPLRIDVAVPGTYTVESAAVTIRGRRYAPGQLVDLERGPVRIGGGRTSEAVLRWGDHLSRPSSPAPEGALFTNY